MPESPRSSSTETTSQPNQLEEDLITIKRLLRMIKVLIRDDEPGKPLKDIAEYPDEYQPLTRTLLEIRDFLTHFPSYTADLPMSQLDVVQRSFAAYLRETKMAVIEIYTSKRDA